MQSARPGQSQGLCGDSYKELHRKGQLYYHLQSNLQIQSTALLEDVTSCAGDFKSGSVFMEVLSIQSNGMLLYIGASIFISIPSLMGYTLPCPENVNKRRQERNRSWPCY